MGPHDPPLRRRAPLAALLCTAALVSACVHGPRGHLRVVAPGMDEGALVDPALRGSASVNGKYEALLAIFTVPQDAARWGAYHDYGWWPGGTWAGVSGFPPGYWVYVAPTWYIWQRVAAPSGG